MLMVTTTVRMVDGVHCYTTGLRPRVALDGELVLRARGLQQRLVCPTTASNDANHSTDIALDNLLCAARELDTSLALFWIVADDSNVVTARTSKASTVAGLFLHVGDNGTFGDGAQRQDVANCQSSVLSSVDELTSIHALVAVPTLAKFHVMVS